LRRLWCIFLCEEQRFYQNPRFAIKLRAANSYDTTPSGDDDEEEKEREREREPARDDGEKRGREKNFEISFQQQKKKETRTVHPGT
jgi:hypothetical protein